jgi:U3 small nucleolar RNA-associated protein 16
LRKPQPQSSALGQKDDNAVSRGTMLYEGRKRMDRIQLPEVLPAEFLTDDSSAEEDGEDEAAGGLGGPIKRRKVSTVEKHMSRQNRTPRDLAVGTTVYRVAKKVDERLAPKAKKFSTGSRESLLKRNRVATSSKGGFSKR